MASETPSTQEGLTQHPFVEKLVPDPAQSVPSTVQFEGLVGRSTRGDDYWRLYFDRDLSDYIEFNEGDVLNSESIAREHSTMGLESTKVWLKHDARITRTHSRQVRADAAETAYARYANPLIPGVTGAERIDVSMRYVRGDHFYTTSWSEVQAVKGYWDCWPSPFDCTWRGGDYEYEGIACYVYNSSVGGTVKLHRLAGPNTPCGDHFYTASRSEAESAVYEYGYVYEGVACYVFPNRAPDTVPLYRLVQRDNGDHFYTASEDEADNAVLRLGYRDEGVACYVFGRSDLAPAAVPFYRMLGGPPLTAPSW